MLVRCRANSLPVEDALCATKVLTWNSTRSFVWLKKEWFEKLDGRPAPFHPTNGNRLGEEYPRGGGTFPDGRRCVRKKESFRVGRLIWRGIVATPLPDTCSPWIQSPCKTATVQGHIVKP